MWPIPLTTLIAAVQTLNVPNVSSSSRDLALAALCFVRAAFLSARFPRRFFREMPSEHPYSPRFRYHVFRGGAVPTLLPRARLPRETISLWWVASSPQQVDDVGRLALSASTSSRINRSHEGTSIHAIYLVTTGWTFEISLLCENSINQNQSIHGMLLLLSLTLGPSSRYSSTGLIQLCIDHDNTESENIQHTA